MPAAETGPAPAPGAAVRASPAPAENGETRPRRGQGKLRATRYLRTRRNSRHLRTARNLKTTRNRRAARRRYRQNRETKAKEKEALETEALETPTPVLSDPHVVATRHNTHGPKRTGTDRRRGRPPRPSLHPRALTHRAERGTGQTRQRET